MQACALSLSVLTRHESRRQRRRNTLGHGRNALWGLSLAEVYAGRTAHLLYTTTLSGRSWYHIRSEEDDVWKISSTDFALVAAWPATIYNYQKQITAGKKGKKTESRSDVETVSSQVIAMREYLGMGSWSCSRRSIINGLCKLEKTKVNTGPLIGRHTGGQPGVWNDILEEQE